MKGRFLQSLVCLVVLTAALLHAKETTTPNVGSPRKQVPGTNATWRKLKGPAAAAILKMKQDHDPRVRQAYEDVAVRMMARGFKETSFVVVSQTVSDMPVVNQMSVFGTVAEWFFPRLSATQGGSYDGATVIWSSWDDGNNDTWEGTIYFEDSDGYWELVEQQSDVTFDNDQGERVLWADLGASRDGRERQRALNLQQHPDQITGRNSPGSIRPVALKLGQFSAGCSWAYMFRDRLCQEVAIAWCNALGCGLASWRGCGRSGPAFIYCSMAMCGLTALPCVVNINREMRAKCGF